MEPIERVHLEPRTGIAFVLQKSHTLRVIDPQGEQVADLICFAESDTKEYSSSGRSIDYNNKIYFSVGDVIYSNLSRPMLTIVEDTVGKHDFLFAPCSQRMFEITYGVEGPHPNCLDNLGMHLRRYGIEKSQIPVTFNIFMNAKVGESGEITVEPPLSKPGDYVAFRAEMDLILAVSACSAPMCNNYSCTAIEVEIHSSKQALGSC